WSSPGSSFFGTLMGIVGTSGFGGGGGRTPCDPGGRPRPRCTGGPVVPVAPEGPAGCARVGNPANGGGRAPPPPRPPGGARGGGGGGWQGGRGQGGCRRSCPGSCPSRRGGRDPPSCAPCWESCRHRVRPPAAHPARPPSWTASSSRLAEAPRPGDRRGSQLGL